MKTLNLNQAEAVILRKILNAYSTELSEMLGQDLSVDFDKQDDDIVQLAADTMNDEQYQPIDVESNMFDLYGVVNYFLEKLESAEVV